MIRRLLDGVRNLIRWTPVIWDDRDYDWEYLARVMSWKMRRMADCLESGFVVDGSKNAQDLRTCANLLDRVREQDGYWDDPSKPWLEPGSGARLEARHQADLELFCKIFGRKLRTWWD